MIGDVSDFGQRLRSLLPPNWFPNQASFLLDEDGDPVLDETGGFIEDEQNLPVILSGLLGAPATVDAFIYSLIAYARSQTRLKTASGGWLDLAAYDFFGLRLQRAAGQTDATFVATIITEIFRIRNTRQAIDQVLFDVTGHHPIIFEPWRPADSGGYNTSAYYGAAGAWGSRNLPFQTFVTAYRGNGLSDAAIYAAVESVRMAGTVIWVKILNP